MIDRRTIAEDVSKTARDAAYVAVGLGVLGFQKAQVHRHDLAQRLTGAGTTVQERIERLADLAGAGTVLQQRLERLGELPGELSRALTEVDSAVEAMITRLETLVEPLEGHLPAVARDAVQQAREQARTARQQLRARVRRGAAGTRLAGFDPACSTARWVHTTAVRLAGAAPR